VTTPRRRRVAGVLLLALCALAGLAGAAAPDALDELMGALAARRHGHVSYTELQQLAVLDRPLRSSGELIYDAPDRLEKRILEPAPETLVLAHGVLSATRGKHTRVVELAASPQLAPLIESLRATLAGDRASLERLFSLDLAGDLAHWTLTLKPRDPSAARSVASVRISGEHAELRTVEILAADGDRSLLSLGAELPP
jgi:hypothetical protein